MSEQKLTGFPSIDKPWLKYYPDCYDESVFEDEIPQSTLYEYLAEKTKRFSSNTAIEYFGKKVSYQKLFEKIDAVANSLHGIGIKCDDVVSICMPNIPESIYSLYAINKIGAVSCLIDPRMGSQAIIENINEVQSKVLIIIDLCFPKLLDVLDEIKVEKIIIVSVCNSLPLFKKLLYSVKNKERKFKESFILTWNQFIKTGNDIVVQDVAKYSSGKTTVISHTGGTTGIPKGVELTDDCYNLMCFSQTHVKNRINMHAKDSVLAIMPLFTAYGSAWGIHVPLSVGMKLILIPSLKPSDFPKLVLKHKPNYAAAVPAFWALLADDKVVKNKKLTFLKTAIVGGDKLDSEIEMYVNDFLKKHLCNVKLTKGYGLTETGSSFTYTFADSVNKPGSAGIPLVYNTYKIVDTGTIKELKNDEFGEICLSGPTVMNGYYNKPEENEKVLKVHEDGLLWFHTGDYGKIGNDGLIYIQDRIKRIIIGPNGHKVYPSRIEKLLQTNGFVKNCAVVGKRAAEYSAGSVPIAYIETEEDATVPGNIKSILYSLCEQNLASCGIPTDFIIIDKLPLTPIGKIDYRKLEEMAKEQIK